MSGEQREQFGRPLRERTDEGEGEIGLDRAGLHESRYVDDPDQLTRLDHSQPLERRPAPEEASAASERADDPEPAPRPDPLTATPPGPSMWEAREPGEGDR